MSSSPADLSVRYKIALVYFAGFALTFLAIKFFNYSHAAHHMLAAIHPFGWTASIVSAFLAFIFLLPKRKERIAKHWLSPNNPFATITLFFLCLWLSFLPALGSWATADPHLSHAIGGILGIKDASQYVVGADQLIQTGEFGQWNQRRPFNTTLLASRLVLAQHDFRSALLLQALFFATALFFLALLVWKQLGLRAAALVIFVNLSFAADYLPTTLSESLGQTLGLIAASFFVFALRAKSKNYYYLAIFVITLALLTRTGPMLVLPLLILCAGFMFSGEKRFSLAMIAFALIPVALAIFFNTSLNHFYTDGSKGPKGSAHFVLYTFSVEGPRWDQVRIDYPVEYESMTETEFEAFAYQKAFENIRNNPGKIAFSYIKGIFYQSARLGFGLYTKSLFEPYRGWISDLVSAMFPINDHQLSRIRTKTPKAITILVITLLAIGFFRLVLYARKDNLFLLLIAVSIGVAMSAPLVYPIAGVRTFATIVPFFSLLAALSLVALRGREAIQIDPTANLRDSSAKALLTYVASLLVLGSIAPLLAYTVYGQRYSEQDFANFSCSDQTGKPPRQKLVMYLGPGTSHLEIVSDASVSTFAPRIRESDFITEEKHSFFSANLGPVAGRIIAVGYNQISNKRVYITGDARLLSAPHGYRVLCAQKNPNALHVIASRRL